jgi:signal peptidase
MLVVALGVAAVVVLILTSSNLNVIRFRRVASGSMEPSLRVESMVLVVKSNVAKLKKGDIINFSKTGSSINITHRIVEISKIDGQTVYVTKGDANNINDLELVHPREILGKVVWSIPYLGYFYLWIKSPIGLITAVILPAVYILISEVLNIKDVIEDNAIKRYRESVKKRKNSHVFSVLFLLGSALSINLDTVTLSYFSSGKVLANNVFSTGSWVLPTPTSTPKPTSTPGCPHPTTTPIPFPTMPDVHCSNFEHFLNLDIGFPNMKNWLAVFLENFFINSGDEAGADYEFMYTSQGVQKGIAGKLTRNFRLDRDLYLGTCTTETCTQDQDIGKTATLSITGRYCSKVFNIVKTLRLY